MKNSLIPLATLILLSSCSWYRSAERSHVNNDEKNDHQSKTVSRKQYDQLLVKYEELAKKYENLKERPASSQGTLIDELQNSQSENVSDFSIGETVEPFASNEKKQPEVSLLEVPSDLNEQIKLFRRGLNLKDSNSDEAAKIFQQLEQNSTPVVRVRAKVQMADILLSKGQYDLSLQIFEDIISNHADSGVVLEALKGAVSAADKLGLPEKRDQYTSMLNDVFSSGQAM